MLSMGHIFKTFLGNGKLDHCRGIIIITKVFFCKWFNTALFLKLSTIE